MNRDVLIEDLDSAFRTLMRGLAHMSYAEVYQAHKALIRIGEPAVKRVKDYIQSMDFRTPQRTVHANFVNGLFSLLLDLNEAEAVSAAQRVIEGGCLPAIAARLKTICEFSVSAFRKYEVRGVRIFESKRLQESTERHELLEMWLSIVPAQDLEDLHRLYVVSREEVDAAGTYTPILFNISLAWSSPIEPGSIFAWPLNLAICRTLYHEIGHHVHRHTFGQDPEQEREADVYADKLFRQQFPAANFFARAIARVLR